MREDKFAKEGLTFDDVLLVPQESNVLPKDVSVQSKLTDTLTLNTPFIIAGMDTVTESDMSIAIARLCRHGAHHKNMSSKNEPEIVDQVKRSERGLITNTVFLTHQYQV